jgi:Methyltransferase domain
MADMTAWLKRASRVGGRLASASTAPATGSSAGLLNVSQPIDRDPDGTDRRLTIFRDILRPMKPGRLLDLGTGHGAFALIAQELGWTVTAVDARTGRMPMTPGITWVEADVRRFDTSGYDCIALLGLLYHLEFEDVRDLLGRCVGTPTILDTHHALRVNEVHGAYEGRTYEEIGEYTPERLAETQTASWGNRASWWPTRLSLIQLLRDTGYRTILVLDPPIRADRTFYLCI